MLLFALAASELSWSDNFTARKRWIFFPHMSCRDLFSELEDTFPQTDLVPHFWAVQSTDPVGQENICSKHFQGHLPSERRISGKQNKQIICPTLPKPKTWCCMLTGLAVRHWKLCVSLGRWARTVWFSPKLASVQVSSKILINYKKTLPLLYITLVKPRVTVKCNKPLYIGGRTYICAIIQLKSQEIKCF